MGIQIHGWLDGCLNGLVEDQMDECVGRWVERKMTGLYGWKDGWVTCINARWICELMDGCVGLCVDG